MTGPIAIIPVPERYLAKPQDAAAYLGVDTDTLKKLAIPCRDFNGRRAYRYDDLKAFADSLPEWKNGRRESPSLSKTKGTEQ